MEIIFLVGRTVDVPIPVFVLSAILTIVTTFLGCVAFWWFSRWMRESDKFRKRQLYHMRIQNIIIECICITDSEFKKEFAKKKDEMLEEENFLNDITP